MRRAFLPWLAIAVIAVSSLAIASVGTLEAAPEMPARARLAQIAVDGAPADSATPAPNTVHLVVHDGLVSSGLDVEIARNEVERDFGLMNRTSLPADGGMLFLFAHDGLGGFWMQDTLIPLDIAFVNSNLAIVTIRQGIPLDLTVLSPTAPYRYVIETNVGWFALHGFGVGSTVELPAGLPAAQ